MRFKMQRGKCAPSRFLNEPVQDTKGRSTVLDEMIVRCNGRRVAPRDEFLVQTQPCAA